MAFSIFTEPALQSDDSSVSFMGMVPLITFNLKGFRLVVIPSLVQRMEEASEGGLVLFHSAGKQNRKRPF